MFVKNQRSSKPYSTACLSIRAAQVDRGSEFATEFEQACKLRGLPVFCAASALPKLS